MAKKIVQSINKYTLATFLLFGFLFFHFAKEMLQARNDGWYVGQVNLYGDLVFHLGFINKFLESGQIIASNPYFSSIKPNYPIFADFITAQVARLTGVDFALFLVTFLMGLLTIYVARNFILNFIKSEKVIFLALLLFFFNGGFGFYYFFQDLVSSQKPFLGFIFSLPNEYTDIKEKGYWWINTYLAYFLPQRGFLFAFPITLTVFSLLYVGYKRNRRMFFVIAGLLSGVLPLVQVHSLFVIFLVSLFLSLITIFLSKFNSRLVINWILFAIITSAVALPIFSAISQIESPLKFIRIEPGWTSEENIIWFWFKNLGIFAPLLIISLFWLFKNKFLFTLYLPFLFIFIISNIFVFQPWDFDNSKLLVYWYFASTIVVAFFVYDQFLVKNLAKKATGVFLISTMVFSGALDVFRTFTPITSYQIFSNSDLEIAESVKNLTAEKSLFLTASSHNHPIPALAGRSTLVGFHGWLWSHGLPYQERANDVKQIYLGGRQAEQLISKYKINYLTIGPLEKSEYQINESFFIKFPTIRLTTGWIIYDVSALWADSNREN